MLELTSRTIPKRLWNRLDNYQNYVDTLIGKLENTIQKPAFFFPEYTLHGWEHIQTVMNNAEKLIPDGTLDHLKAGDIAILACAVILHDLGMFLNEKGVKMLLTDRRSSNKTQYLDEHDWKTEWDMYIQEIRRYPKEKLLYHFGIDCPIEEPNFDNIRLGLDQLVIGEFLRRHHHRIAHEIALETMPGDSSFNVLQVGTTAAGNEVFGISDRRKIGILARSHYMSIKDTWKYIEHEIGESDLQTLTYLMAVLRVADALDAGESRVPVSQWTLDGIHTPISVQEWTWNKRVEDKDPDWNTIPDGKCLKTEPTSTTEFVCLEKWLCQLQLELDTSWAILSGLRNFDRYRLSIHRIQSDVLEEKRRESFAREFVTKEARLKADPELLKLLVEPLYQSDPSCGVRELIQNAVDACNERKYRAKKEGKDYTGTVEVRLDTKEKTLTVTDDGVGMDENVILNYYLSAGASFRNSDEWQREFAKDRDPNIVRNGHFGVGVLATFLLGNKVHVKTRCENDLGYIFDFGMEPGILDIRRPNQNDLNEQIELGTTITVDLKEEALTKLLADYRGENSKQTWLNWYRFEEPTVWYFVDGKPCGPKEPKPSVPQEKGKLTGWFELQTEQEDQDKEKAEKEKAEKNKYKAVLWGYPHDGFFCNGIRIPWGMPEKYTYDDVTIVAPSVSVIDKNGNIPVDIARRFLDEGFTLLKAVERETTRYAMARLLAADWSSEDAAAERLEKGIPIIRHTGSDMIAPLICRKNEYTLLHAPFLRKEDKNRLLVFYLDDYTDLKKLIPFLRGISLNRKRIMVYPTRLFGSDPLQNVRKVFGIYNEPPFETRYYDASFRRVYIRNELCQGEEYAKCVRNGDGLSIEKGQLFTKHEYKNDNTDARYFQKRFLDPDICPAVSEVLCGVSASLKKTVCDDTKDSLLSFVDTYMNEDPWIPYDMEARKRKFPDAFEILDPYIKSLKRSEVRHDA